MLIQVVPTSDSLHDFQAMVSTKLGRWFGVVGTENKLHGFRILRAVLAAKNTIKSQPEVYDAKQ